MSLAKAAAGGALAFYLSLSAFASAEYSVLYQKQGLSFLDEQGRSVAAAGDINGDGVADFIIGANGARPQGLIKAGSAFVYSGIDGTLLFEKHGDSTWYELGWACNGAGDVNGDGRADFIIGARSVRVQGMAGAGSAFVYSGLDGSLLYRKDGAAAGDEMGFSVAGAGDVNGDGKADFIIGARWTEPGGRAEAGSAYVYSGADGALLFQKDGAAGDWLGYSVAGAGDVNADGRDDFIIGAPLASPDGRARAGSAYLYSGMDGGLLRQVNGPLAGDFLGLSIAGAGDVNGDGTADFITGAPYADRDGKADAGLVLLFSGLNGAVLFEKKGVFPLDYLGWTVAGAGDVNADGKPDFMAGAPFSNPDGHTDAGSALVFSGADGTVLFQKGGIQGYGDLGWSLAGLGDVNGDGKSDFIIGSPGSNSASIYVGCAAKKGDFNADGGFFPADLVLTLLCVFPGRGNCGTCFADLNCDGLLTIADVVSELNAVFLQIPPPC